MFNELDRCVPFITVVVLSAEPVTVTEPVITRAAADAPAAIVALDVDPKDPALLN